MLKLLRCSSSATSMAALLCLSLTGCYPPASQGLVIHGSSSKQKAPQADPDEQDPDEQDPGDVKEQVAPERNKTTGTAEKEWEDISSAKFSNSTNITNEWFPLKPGTQFTWSGTSIDDEGAEEAHWVIFTVTDLTREVAGIKTIVCWDQDYIADPGEPFEKAELVETEVVFFAQADDGTIWHLGQYPEEYEDGKLIASPGWLHGLEDGTAGIYMPGKPKLGDRSFSQGWAPSVPWTDRAVVYQVGQQVKGPTGSYDDVLVFDETCKEDPEVHALKYYARGVGGVKVGWRGDASGGENMDLAKVEQLDDAGLAKAREAAQKLQNSADAYYAKMKPAVQKIAAPAPKAASNANAKQSNPAQLGTEEFGLTKRELVQKIEQVEALIAKFMREEGFEYVACDYKTVYSGMAADKSMPGVSEDEFITKYGFGVSTLYTGQPPQLVNGYSPTKVGLGAKNIEIFQSLSPADQVAYNRALFGENWDASFAVGLETENFARCGGCTRKAIEQVFEVDQLKPNYYNPKDALINKDPRMKAALRQFVDKMREEGFSYNHPDEVETDLRERLAAITGGEFVPVEKMAPEKLDALKKLQDYERRVALLSFKLQGDVFDPVEEKIEKELFAREVK